jgi:beta-lactamase class A
MMAVPRRRAIVDTAAEKITMPQDPPNADTTSTEHESAALEVVFRNVGVTGYLHAVDLGTGHEITLRADEPVVSASVFKLPVLVELWRQASTGALDPTTLVTIPAGDRVASPYGLAQMSDPVTMSIRDLATLMISVSDNVATDYVCAAVGLDNVRRLLDDLELRSTSVDLDVAGIFRTMGDDAGNPGVNEWEDPLDHEMAAKLRALDPLRTNHTTARDTTRLLQLVWTDRAAPADACEEVRRVLGLQVWPHRLVSGWPEPGVTVSGKTGTLPYIRNEVGVVELPDGSRYAVAVFTRSPSLSPRLPQVDAVIGTAGRVAVDLLKAGVAQGL